MKAIIFGITGQDGSYLADLLLDNGYEVIGVARRASTNTNERIKHLNGNKKFRIVEGDITDYSSIIGVLSGNGKVNEVYNLAAQSHVGTSFKQPGLTWDVTGKGCMNLLQAIVDLGMQDVRFYQASSSEMYGASFDERLQLKVENGDVVTGLYGKGVYDNFKYQDENTKHLPQSPYAIAKCAAHMTVRLYREAYGIHGSCGILFNHESPRRGDNFVTKKITKWIGEFYRWMNSDSVDRIITDYHNMEDYICSTDSEVKLPKLRLGNLDARRDWGHAKDYVNAMYLMLQQDKPDDYVICTGQTWSIRDFLDTAFAEIGIEDWEPYVIIDPEFYRPAEVDYLLGDCTKAVTQLGWTREYNFNDLVKEMVRYEINQPIKEVSC